MIDSLSLDLAMRQIDIDSRELETFDEVDKEYLEQIVSMLLGA